MKRLQEKLKSKATFSTKILVRNFLQMPTSRKCNFQQGEPRIPLQEGNRRKLILQNT
jgi:hypothetical protein